MAVLTISRNFASGGRRLGRHLARRLGYDYVDKSYFQKIAEDLHVSQRTLESFDKGRQYRITNIFSRLFSKSYIERIVGYDKTVVEEHEYQKALRGLVREVASQDNIVIIGRAAYFFLKDLPNCYNFRLVAPPAWRKRYAIQRHNVPESYAERTLEERDRNRSWFLQSICGEGFDEPLHFHLTVNMSLIAFEQVVELLLLMVEPGKR